MLITLRELFDIVVMVAATGYIFMGFVGKRHRHRDVLARFQEGHGFDWPAFWTSVIITAPALIAHELAHKFVAIALGLEAVFHAAYTWLGIGIALKLLGSGFIFFIPGYVSIGELSDPMSTLLIAGAGPFLNLVLWLGSALVLKAHQRFTKRAYIVLFMTKTINMWLFVLNMLPLPFADGFKVYASVWRLIAG